MKKFLSVLLTVCMLFSMTVMAIPANAVEDLLLAVNPLSTESAVEVATYEDLVTALEDDAVTNIVITKTIKVSTTATFDISGKNITADFDDASGAIYVGTTGNLTITGNGSITSNGIVIGNYGTVTVEGGTITTRNTTGAVAALYNFYYNASTKGTAIINNGNLNYVFNCGTLDVNGGEIAYLDNSGAATVDNATVGTLIARDGTNAAGVAGAGTVTVGTTATVTNTTYYVTTYDALVAALANGGEIVLGADITATAALKVTKDTVINGNGHTLTYTGSGASARAITVEAGVDADLTINDLTVDCTASYCQRGINYNTTGALTLDNVTVKGKNVTYAVSLPGSADNAVVNITNSDISGNIAVNVWGENMKINITDTALTSVDNNTTESYGALKLNNDGVTSAEGTVVTVTGGSITAEDDSNAYSNDTATGVINISDTTEVDGNNVEHVAIVDYGTDQCYSYTSLQDAINKAIETNGTVKLLKDVTSDEIITISGAVVIDGNGHKVTSSASRVFQIYGENTTVEMNDVNVVDTAVRTGTNDIRGININPDCSGVVLTLNNCSVDFTDTSASDWAYGVNVTRTAGACTLNINGGSYEGANVINVWGEGTKVNINGATLTSLYAANDLYVGACVKLEGANIDATVKNTTFAGENAVATDSAKDNCTFTTTNNTDNTKYYVAKVGSEYFYTIADAIAAAKAGEVKTIVLLTTIVLDKDTVLDLTGLTVVTAATEAGNYVDAFTILADVTVTGGTVDARPSHGYTFYIGNKDGAAGNLIIEDGKFYGETSVVTNRHGNVTINGGEFDISLEKAGDTYNYVINCVDESYKNGSATITVKGGKFVGFNPANNAAEGTSTNFAAEGYVGVDNGDGTYSVEEKEEEETALGDIRIIPYSAKVWSFTHKGYINRIGVIADLDWFPGSENDYYTGYSEFGFILTLNGGSTVKVPAYKDGNGNVVFQRMQVDGVIYTPNGDNQSVFANVLVFTDAELASVQSIQTYAIRYDINSTQTDYDFTTEIGAATEFNF